MPSSPEFTQLKRAIASFTAKAPLIYDIAKTIASRKSAILLLAVMHDLEQTVKDMKSVAAQRVIELTPYDERFTHIPVPGGGTLKFRGGKEVERYVDQSQVVGQFAQGIAEELIAHHRLSAVVTEDGETIPSSDALPTIIKEACDTMAEATGAMAPSFDSWRSGVAKRFGIDLKSLATTRPTDLSVMIEGRSRD